MGCCKEGEENKEGRTLVEDGERGGERRVGTLVEGGVMQGEESGEGGNTGRWWGRRAERVGTLVEDGERGGERRGWEHW